MPIGRAEAATGRREQRRRRSVSLRMSMVGLAGLVVVATGANALYQRQVALGDARSTGTAAAWSAAIRTSNRELAVTLVALILFVAAVWVLQRRIVGSLTRLGAGVRAATLNRASGSFVLAAPAEVSALVDDFNELLRTTGRELEAASRLSTIVESSADAIFTQTPAGVITTWNTGAEHVYGYAAGEVVGRNASMLIPLDRVPATAAILAKIQSGQRVEHLETEGLTRDGTIFALSISVSPIRDARGAVVGASTVASDMTERNLVEADRRAMENRLQQSERLESLGQLAGGIAHDFNNLLVAIVNYSAFVADETIDNPAVRADVEQIQVAAERAARLTNQLLSFAERTAAAPEALDLNAIVVDVHDLLDSSLGANIELVVESRETLPSIRADRSHIEQVLVDLAVNARDAMPAGGTLTIETSAVDLDEGYAHLRPVVGGGHFVELAVSDTGTGMSTEVAAHIFEPFFTTKPTGEGTGLSLATVYGTIVESGGTMSVYSERGVGTTFKFYFPATDAPVEATPMSIAPRGNGETILIVEDEPSVLELTSRILRRNGYIALQSATIEAAVSMAAAHDFQLLLTDSVMPESSGRALAARVDELRPGRPVLYMSGHSQGVHRAVGDALFIQKPFNSRTLLEQVHTALTRPSISRSK